MNSKISSPYRDHIVISWPELHRDTRILCHALMEKGPFKGIIAIARGGMPVLMVEQNAQQAMNIADKAYVLVQGANAHTGTGKELMANEEVRRTFLGG